MRHSRLTWQDLYYDGIIDERNELWDEDSQCVIEKWYDDGWDDIEELYILDYIDNGSD
ncbi:hypothetical protein [Paenibacillus elgii]|uniref:hypothetical protein n=1 Tax=Paenibacillus elgii TaxID=189691 RepID=UPI00203F12C5|nr:hypothetical protein [Paenibacillus elgii]MCM3270861.1 hypothetical protein [Paenibacillus elgii]